MKKKAVSMEDRNRLGLYIHIPFCRAKCHYCDFNSFCGREELIPAYFDALQKEIVLYASRLESHTFRTVFIGGGTPSLVEQEHIYNVLNTCRQYFKLDEGAEISIETNPGTLSYEKLLAYRVMGINRLSIGLQAWQEPLLKMLGRIHDREAFVQNFQQARKAGFQNINVDLIFGIPGQTLEDWSETLVNVARLEPTHLSCYSLKIEEGTPFGDRYETGELIPLEDELDRQMYERTLEFLNRRGYRHYEISNFARPGYECKHNLIYWKAESYIGLGAGAHSYFRDQRYSNPENLNEYIRRIQNGELPWEKIEKIDSAESMGEFMILGLRLTDGIGMKEFRDRYGRDLLEVYGKPVDKLLERALLEQEGDRLRLTPEGLDLANQVFMEFV
jgi:oxygen-independent coproporphyrinogen III oxidase